jgi:hypothetical protein
MDTNPIVSPPTPIFHPEVLENNRNAGWVKDVIGVDLNVVATYLLKLLLKAPVLLVAPEGLLDWAATLRGRGGWL